MSAEEDTKPSEFLANHLARKGPDEVKKVQASVDRARELLASGEVQLYREGENPFELAPYPWEVSEVPANAPRRIFLGTVSDLATGQGHTVYFAAALAWNEDEFRRKMAAHIGHALANGAKVNPGVEDFHFSKTFISPSLRQTLEKFDEGKDAPAAFFFLSQWHENRS
ncbi:hypothetical protein WJT74_06565 [Sphingomicrobium sp. XHP0239]|uniref:hypothetical protein n=1 Tax=Sphingomicrobium maritimum TaxID=3133972 RepID=UPI0031CC5E72